MGQSFRWQSGCAHAEMEPILDHGLQIEGDRPMPPKIPELLRDARNVKLLRLLREEPRISVSELARRIGMSAPAVKERIQRLEETGVIRETRMDLDPKALGYPIAAFVRVRPMPGKLPKIAELARKM